MFKPFSFRVGSPLFCMLYVQFFLFFQTWRVFFLIKQFFQVASDPWFVHKATYSPRLTKSDIFCNGSQSKVKSLHLLTTLGKRMPFNNLLTTTISQQRKGQELSDTVCILHLHTVGLFFLVGQWWLCWRVSNVLFRQTWLSSTEFKINLVTYKVVRNGVHHILKTLRYFIISTEHFGLSEGLFSLLFH